MRDIFRKVSLKRLDRSDIDFLNCKFNDLMSALEMSQMKSAEHNLELFHMVLRKIIREEDKK